MLKTFTRLEMLAYWKRRLSIRVSPVLTNVDDLTELDRKLLADIELWYADLLAEAPVEKLPVEDVAEEASCRYISDNAAEVVPPERGVRLVALRMADWTHDEVETFSVYSDMARLQRNRLTRATTDEPVVIHRHGRYEVHGLTPPEPILTPSDPTLPIPSPPKPPEITRMRMVVRPEEGIYILDTTLLRRTHLYIH